VQDSWHPPTNLRDSSEAALSTEITTAQQKKPIREDLQSSDSTGVVLTKREHWAKSGDMFVTTGRAVAGSREECC
jgi:hypothetical protein